MSSLGKKYIMALSGLVLVGFACGHMVGNLQMFLHPDWINEYAYKLQHLPYGLLWVVRIVMLTCVVAHIATAVLLVIENYKARPDKYVAKANLQGSFASRTMKYSLETELTGTTTLHHVYDKLLPLGKTQVHDVYSMVAYGFSTHYWYGIVPVFYIISMALLCFHLMHGISSMFQSLGLRNAVWRTRLDRIALVVAIVVFVGFWLACLAFSNLSLRSR
jgi:succinate dehydrogenase / fumarate reductase cytochrome b subunit